VQRAPRRAAPTCVERAPSPQALARSREREQRQLERLWRRMHKRGGAGARNALVDAYQYLVQSAVRRLLARLPRSVEPGDLLAAANVGLIAAIEAYEPARGVPFETYCEWRLRGALLDELRVQDWLPRPWRTRLARLRRAAEELRSQLGREPTDDEVGEWLGWSAQELAQVSDTQLAPHGHGAERGALWGAGRGAAHANEDAPALEDLLADRDAEPLGEKLTRDELLRVVTQHMTPQECRVVYLKYWEELPLREIGELEGLSESRVCKIHLRLLERLRAELRRTAGDE
jgi:RNA polymerase sigma factor for flagellar operon FliA